MIKSTKALFSRILLLLMCFALCCFMPACGGGGGGSSSGDTDGDGVVDVNNSTLTLELSSNTITFGTPVTVTATLTDAAGEPASNVVVTFVAASDIVVFTPTVATALTNADGVATIILNAANIDSAGATSISASASITFQDASVTTTSPSIGVTVGGAAITLGTLTVGTSPISAYGTSSVSVPVLVGGAAATVPISVSFTSPCVSSGKATITSPVTSSAGVVTSTYTDIGCASGTTAITDTITASSGDATASGTIRVNPTVISNIQFISATPTIIGTSTASASSLQKQSAVKFQVVDGNAQGKPGVDVTFSMLPSNYGSMGITLSPATATSDADGYVTTYVRSGPIPTPAWVVATVTSSPSIQTQSNSLTITTGLPTQNFFSLSNKSYNIEGWKYDGVTTVLTVIASDRLGNPVPDGTAINFISEGGDISNGSTQATCHTTNGTCTITFTSSEYRPTDGRVTILAYAVGEKSFVDANGNNSYDTGETFYDLGDIYLDANENRVWDTGEQYISYVTGTNACRTQPGGTALPLPTYYDIQSKENSCTASWGVNYVRRTIVIALSGSSAYISPDTFTNKESCFATYDFMLMDTNGNPMPEGTRVEINSSLSNVNYTYHASNGADPPSIITVAAPAQLNIAGSPVLNTTAVGGTKISAIINGGSGCIAAETVGIYVPPAAFKEGELIKYPYGPLAIDVTTPKGNVTTITLHIE